MTKPIAIIAGEPNSISSEIIFKSWKLRKRYIHKPLLVIGSIRLLNLQKKSYSTHLQMIYFTFTLIFGTQYLVSRPPKKKFDFHLI